jgi:hypothetical protein
MTAPTPQQFIQGQGTVSADNLNTFQQTCSDISQLRSVIGLPGMQMFTQGSVTPGDGGSRVYYWNQSSVGPDNGTTIIVPQTGVPGAWIAMTLAQTTTVTQYSVGTGTGSAVTATFAPPITSISPGNIFWIDMPATNTGPITLNVGTGFLPILGAAGLPLQGGEITPGLIGVAVSPSETSFQLFSAVGAFQVGSAQSSEQSPQWQQIAAGNNVSWNDEGSSRSIGVTYTNTSGRPLFVSVTATMALTGNFLVALINGFGFVNSGGAYGAGAQVSIFFVVPIGATYSVVPNINTATLVIWSEL